VKEKNQDTNKKQNQLSGTVQCVSVETSLQYESESPK